MLWTCCLGVQNELECAGIVAADHHGEFKMQCQARLHLSIQQVWRRVLLVEVCCDRLVMACGMLCIWRWSSTA